MRYFSVSKALDMDNYSSVVSGTRVRKSAAVGRGCLPRGNAGLAAMMALDASASDFADDS